MPDGIPPERQCKYRKYFIRFNGQHSYCEVLHRMIISYGYLYYVRHKSYKQKTSQRRYAFERSSGFFFVLLFYNISKVTPIFNSECTDVTDRISEPVYLL